jgi:hypothetical protein
MELSRDELEVVMELLYDEKSRLDDGIFEWENGTPEELMKIVRSLHAKIYEQWRIASMTETVEAAEHILYWD